MQPSSLKLRDAGGTVMALQTFLRGQAGAPAAREVLGEKSDPPGGEREGHHHVIRAAVDAEMLSDPTVVALAPLLSPVLLHTIPDNARTTHMTGKVREANTIKVMLRVLELKLRGARGVLALDDCQHMDAASWRLTQLAVSMLQGELLFLLCARSSMLDKVRLRQREKGASC